MFILGSVMRRGMHLWRTPLRWVAVARWSDSEDDGSGDEDRLAFWRGAMFYATLKNGLYT
jgi:hypothetical protein